MFVLFSHIHIHVVYKIIFTYILALEILFETDGNDMVVGMVIGVGTKNDSRL